MSNGVIEPLLLGFTAGLPLMLKAMAGRFRWRTETAYFIGLAISCMMALVVFYWMPALPE